MAVRCKKGLPWDVRRPGEPQLHPGIHQRALEKKRGKTVGLGFQLEREPSQTLQAAGGMSTATLANTEKKFLESIESIDFTK